uniref:uncharacterized protein LOC122587803 n=1 Tax=Erigeron canadensis TaxID=72917 RepID=UPI001CB9C176|nr:uncharacterized protein LOC122587803 [Erigeron canadensis]
MSNGGTSNKGTRIILGWNSDVVDVMILAQTDQVIHAQIIYKVDQKGFFCSFIYADNYYKNRRALWQNLCYHKNFVKDRPWCILGDFNSSLDLEDSFSGTSTISIGMRDFKECVNSLEMFDINGSGLHYTWNQKPKKGIGILKKIDRVMGNIHFIDCFPSACAIFQPYRVSDHSPCILKLPNIARGRKPPFKFANFFYTKAEFQGVVEQAWNTEIDGVNQYRVVKKLKLLKTPFQNLLFKQGNLHKRVDGLRTELDDIQRSIDQEPDSARLQELESDYLQRFKEAVLDEENFLKQKSKIDWLATGGNVSKTFVQHYEKFLGIQGDVSLQPAPDLFTKVLNRNTALKMIREVSDTEIKDAMFSIFDIKAPGPDGFSSAFFKKAWSIVGKEVSLAIHDFFKKGKLLKELNHTILALIPKNQGGLDEVVSVNQSAFVPVRKISDNILLTQEIMHNYHRNQGPPRCTFKVDIQKAYDTVDWDFLRAAMFGFGYHPVLINWVMLCVSSTTFSLSINGQLHGFFKGKRGLGKVILSLHISLL